MAFLKLSVILTVAESGSYTGWLVGAGVWVSKKSPFVGICGLSGG